MPNKRIEDYVFTDDGKIVKGLEEIKVVNKNVVLELTFGNIVAEAAKLFVIARSRLLDLSHYKNIKVFFNDEDEDNYSVGNIEYIFSEPIECREKSGFYIVPGFTNHAINKDGELFNRTTLKNNKWTIWKCDEKQNCTGGYLVGTAVSDSKKLKGIKRHRLLGLVFLPPDTNPKHLWINHINGIPGDDRLDNLEWVTPGQNIKHAYRTGLCVKELVKVSVKNVKTGKIQNFNSAIECAEHFHLSHSGVLGRLLKPNVAFDGHQFKRDDGSSWPDVSRSSNGKPEEVKLVGRNVITGEQISFNNSLEAQKHTGFNALGITRHASERRIAPIGKWNFRLDIAGETFPNHNEINLRTYVEYPHKPPRPIVGVNVDKFFLSVNEFSEYVGKSIYRAYDIATKNIEINKEIFRFYNREEGLGAPIQLLRHS